MLGVWDLLLRDAGLAPTRNTYVFFGACAGDPRFPDVVENMAGVVEGARAAVLAGGFDEAAFDAALREVRAWKARDDAALWYAVNWAEARRP